MKRVLALLTAGLVLARAGTPDVRSLALFSSSRGNCVATDRAGNVYVTGYIGKTNVTFGTHTVTGTGSSSMFVAKFDKSGSNVWVTVAGGHNEGRGIALDADGNVYVSGSLWNSNVTNTFGNTNIVANGGEMFLTKLDSAGQFQWVRRAVGSWQVGTTLCLSGTNIFVTAQGSASYSSVDLGTTNLTKTALFLAIYDLTGNVITARTFAAKPIQNPFSWQIAVAADGSYYTGLDFDSATISFGGTNATRSGGYGDSLLTKWDANGNLLWFRQLKSGVYGTIYGVALAPNGDVLVAGEAYQGGTFMGQSITRGFAARLTSEGDLVWLTKVGTNSTVECLTIDFAGNVLVSGSAGPGVMPIAATLVTNSSSSFSPYVACLSPAGNLSWFRCATAITDEGYAHSITTDPAGGVAMTGMAMSSMQMGSQSATHVGAGWNALLARFTPEPPLLRIERSANALTLNWPSNRPGFVLEQATQLSGPWSTNTAVSDVGLEFVCTNGITNSAQFFRLREE